MPTKIVAVDNYPITRIEGFNIFEVDNKLVFPVKKTQGLAALLQCATLADLRALVTTGIVPCQHQWRKIQQAEVWLCESCQQTTFIRPRAKD